MPITDLDQRYWQEEDMSFHRHMRLLGGPPLRITMSDDAEGRLANTCFRGAGLRLAGNFHRFERIGQLLRDDIVLDALLKNVSTLDPTRDAGNHSININYGWLVGWAGTAPLSDFGDEDLEIFKINRRCEGLRLKLDRTDICAPRARNLTLVYEMRPKPKGILLIIHSAYPGEDVGIMAGNVSLREQVAFFDWNHPGALAIDN